jgi:hypothetical protein
MDNPGVSDGMRDALVRYLDALEAIVAERADDPLTRIVEPT